MPHKTTKTVAKATGSKSPASKTGKTVKTAAKPVVAAKPAAKPAMPPRVEEKKVLTQRQGFKTNEFVVYPAHGVGQILAIEEQEIAGAKLELFVINFMKDKMTLRVPTAKVANVGMRKLSEPALVKRALETLKGRARVKRTMWSRRAQEYEAKINSGDIVAIAEVVRDLYRSESQPEQSYSERQLYEAALDRLSREIAVVQHSTETEAVKEIETQLAKSPRRGAKAEAGAEGEGDAEGDIDESDDADGDDAAVADEAA
jgi:CarD family transcriptional regulator